MDAEFVTYQLFSNEADSKELILCLVKNEIEYQFEDTSANFALSDLNNDFNREFRVRIRKQDIDKVNKLMLDVTSNQLDHIPKDYYIFSFSNEELFEILLKADEWSKLDYSLALKVLGERQVKVDENLIKSLRKQRLADLAKPEGSQRTWILAGYVFSILGGLIGILIGWHLYTHKKTLPNGARVYGYSTDDRRHGNRILFLGIFFSIIWIVFRLYVAFYSTGINSG